MCATLIITFYILTVSRNDDKFSRVLFQSFNLPSTKNNFSLIFLEPPFLLTRSNMSGTRKIERNRQRRKVSNFSRKFARNGPKTVEKNHFSKKKNILPVYSRFFPNYLFHKKPNYPNWLDQYFKFLTAI